MSDEYSEFKQSLLRMMEAGAFEEMLECQTGEPAAVEFRLERVYRVSLRRGTIVLKERDSETIRRKLNGRWQRLSPPRVRQDRVVVERPMGNRAQDPSAGPAKGPHRPAKRREPRQKQPVLAGAA